VRRRLALVGALAVVLAGVGATSAPAAKHMQIGLQDDAQFLFGNPDVAFPYVKLLHVGIVRANLYWGGVHAVARRRPAHPMDPSDPAYDWGPYDRAVFYATQERARVLFTILATPSWANGNHATSKAPTNPLDLQRFAYAAAKRYSGTFAAADGRLIPPVRMWMAWNEPNAPAFLNPQYAIKGGKLVIQSAIDYAKICNAVYAGVHGTLLGAEKVACGATNPRGSNNPNSLRPSVSPLAFLRAAKAAGMKKFDAYAHHPYYQRPTDSPAAVPKVSTAITLGNIDVLIKEVTRLYGPKRIWITEYGYQTNPPDRTFGVTPAKQALYLKQAFAIARANPRIDLMVWFLLRDEGRISDGWQSGLLTVSGARKPAFAAFQKLPH
jgi:hypothetical protein